MSLNDKIICLDCGESLTNCDCNEIEDYDREAEDEFK